MSHDISRAYTVHLSKIVIQTWAPNSDTAVDIVLKHELAPFSAFEAVYQDNPVPYVDTKYGAPMGRMSGNLDHDNLEDGKWKAEIVDLDEGGYDDGGAYWGLRCPGEHLFAVQDGMGHIAFVDAANTNEALAAAAA
jgi:hypothetical protein